MSLTPNPPLNLKITRFYVPANIRCRCSLRARQITYVILYTEGFGRFVSSTTARIATGWSESCRVGSNPLRDRAFSRRTTFLAHGFAHRLGG